eukprot:TRINITY_DN23548_c0_g1_i1.p1 TRINITY_DN23548_c0_g1~~TRINITY_DN23548_c0_g1_i1.p1  ORF type:complete len:466 (+),score=58.87 TRINITY_DN23548_c0_g1_i1:36-1433(+)
MKSSVLSVRLRTWSLLYLGISNSVFVSSWKLDGSTALGPGKAKVVAKFCFDYNPACKDGLECKDSPGAINFAISGAQIQGGSSKEDQSQPQMYVAMLDDEYFSFPEVSQVWNEVNCTDVTKAAKRSYELNWQDISTAKGQSFETRVVEKVRPRWWYVAIASCSKHSLTADYRLSLENSLKGAQKELSMDEIGLVTWLMLLVLLLAGIVFAQLDSIRRWQQIRCGSPAGHYLLSGCVLTAFVGYFCWLSFFRQYQASGHKPAFLADVARALVVAAKTTIQILLMMFAYGEGVCSAGIAWAKHKECIVLQLVFGVLVLFLELWGDRETRGSPSEYIYDTRAGTGLVAVELLWLYAYISRCWQTWQVETRARPRAFYKRFATSLSLWFAQVAIVAAIASVLSPWVRFRIIFVVNGFAHALAISALVYIFHPKAACEIFELQSKDHEVSLHNDELQGMLVRGKEEDDYW